MCLPKFASFSFDIDELKLNLDIPPLRAAIGTRVMLIKNLKIPYRLTNEAVSL